jgi:hypothetical protein
MLDHFHQTLTTFCRAIIDFSMNSEGIRKARLLAMRTGAENCCLKRKAAVGFAQLEAGEIVRVTTKKQFMALARGRS